MQYLWKLTVLGLNQQVSRLVSLDGELPLDSVLNLCSLAFDFDNYPEKSLYFAQGDQGRSYFDQVKPLESDAYGSQKNEYWRYVADPESAVAQGALIKIDLQNQSTFKLKFASQVINEYMGSYAQELERINEQQPAEWERAPVFIYQLHGVNLLVEIMKSAPKLKCFVPAALAGRGLVADEQQNLSLELLASQLKQQEQLEEQTGEGTVLDLRACTGRMRALQTSLAEDKVNDVMVQGGAAPLKFEIH